MMWSHQLQSLSQSRRWHDKLCTWSGCSLMVTLYTIWIKYLNYALRLAKLLCCFLAGLKVHQNHSLSAKILWRRMHQTPLHWSAHSKAKFPIPFTSTRPDHSNLLTTPMVWRHCESMCSPICTTALAGFTISQRCAWVIENEKLTPDFHFAIVSWLFCKWDMENRPDFHFPFCWLFCKNWSGKLTSQSLQHWRQIGHQKPLSVWSSTVTLETGFWIVLF